MEQKKSQTKRFIINIMIILFFSVDIGVGWFIGTNRFSQRESYNRRTMGNIFSSIHTFTLEYSYTPRSIKELENDGWSRINNEIEMFQDSGRIIPFSLTASFIYESIMPERKGKYLYFNPADAPGEWKNNSETVILAEPYATWGSRRVYRCRHLLNYDKLAFKPDIVDEKEFQTICRRQNWKPVVELPENMK